MDAFAAGEAAAFDRLFERHARAMLTYLVHLTGDRARAEDLLQEVFLRVIRGRTRYRPEGRFRAWLFTIARNLTTDQRRRRAARPEAEPEEEGEPTSDGTAWSDPAAAAQQRDLEEAVLAALASLPVEQREVFLLRERAGLEYTEIARLTGVASPTLRSRMRTALERLRARLAPHFDPQETSRG